MLYIVYRRCIGSIMCPQKIDYVHYVNQNKLKMRLVSCFNVWKYSAQRQAFSNKVQGIEPNFKKKKIQRPGQVQHFGRGAGKLFVAVLSHVRGVGQIKNIFSLVLRGTCYFSRGLHNGCELQDYVFLRKNTGYLSESCWRGITYQN